MLKNILKSAVLVILALFSLQAQASWYECRSLVNETYFSFDESSSQQIDFRSPLRLNTVEGKIQNNFFMTKLSDTVYSADTSMSFDYPCNYQGSTLLFDTSNFQIQIVVSCDGSNPFVIQTEKFKCKVY